MDGRTVELTVAGETYRVITTADEHELEGLAAMVEDKLTGLWQPGRPISTRAMVLAAISLAHDVTEQRARADGLVRKAREGLLSLLGRVDGALQESEEIARERESRSKGRTRGGDSTRGSRSPNSTAARLRGRDGDDATEDR